MAYSGRISCMTRSPQGLYNWPACDVTILGLQPRDKAAMLVVNTKEIFLINLHQNRVQFPVERNAFVLDHQHGRRDVTCKPAIPQIYRRLNPRDKKRYYATQNFNFGMTLLHYGLSRLTAGLRESHLAIRITHQEDATLGISQL